MNRIETRIIIMITNTLASAPESDAKTEMIEELSENLFQRYLEFTAGGMGDEEALQHAMDSLGNVDELLAYLKEDEGSDQNTAESLKNDRVNDAFAREGSFSEKEKPKDEEGQISQNGQGEDQSGFARTTQTEDGADTEDPSLGGDEDKNEGESTAKGQDEGSQGKDEKGSKRNWEREIEDIVNAAINTATNAAMSAMDCANDIAKEVTEQIHRKYPDGVFAQFNVSRGERVENLSSLSPEMVRSVEVRLSNGDVQMSVSKEPGAFIEIYGDTDAIETVLEENGTLIVRQGNTASASFFFSKGIRHSDLRLCLPEKHWEKLTVSTTCGDIGVEDPLLCRRLNLSTVHGDVIMDAECSCDAMTLRTVSGDIRGKGPTWNLRAESKSGDVEFDGKAKRGEVNASSGDIRFCGESEELSCNSASGDINLRLSSMPRQAKVNSKSGDCTLLVPEGTGFALSYRTNGSFLTSLPFVGEHDAKSGNLVLGDGEGGEIQLSSISGDLTVNAVTA